MIESVIEKATKKENLTYEEARMTMTELMNGTATPVQASAYLVSMAMKGETIDEIAASAEGMRAAGTKLQTNRKVAEIVGTGGDGSDSFNISTTASFVIASAGIPVAKLTESEKSKTLNLASELKKRVVGQDEAVEYVSDAIIRSKAGIKDPSKPIGSFIFLGPTGVGKTELSKALAEALFGKEDAMIRVDMSEYMEKHSVAKMIGSPPGYVGHDDGGQLSEQVRRHPYSVVLFDEIEKAHPDVFNILLQVLDDGHITDSQGRKVDFSNTVIIMTSNAGAQSIIDPKKLGFNTKEDAAGDYKRMKNNVMNEIKFIFRPEFLNRIDEILVFHPLTTEQMQKIVGLMCKELVKRAKEQLGIHLTIRDSVKKHIVETGMDKKYGARPLRRAVQNQLEDKLAEAILSGEIGRDMDVVAGMSKKEIKFTAKTTN